MIVAIDGPAGAGKSSVAKEFAKRLNMLYIDTGAMYRALTWKGLNKNIDISNNNQMADLLKVSEIELVPNNDNLKVFIDGIDITFEIREPLVTNNVSLVSSHKDVRSIMTDKQRKLGSSKYNVVMDGRDIGTVVFPNADVKIYLTASVKERATRRYKEQITKGIDSNLDDLINEISRRDYYDSNREVAPLKSAEDAIIVDTTEMSYSEVLESLINIANQKAKLIKV